MRDQNAPNDILLSAGILHSFLSISLLLLENRVILSRGMVALDRELGSDNFKRTQDCSAHNNHDEVQSETQESKAFREVSARAVTWEEEMT